MARNFFKIFEGLSLNPRNADPTSPGEGDIQFSNGTARDKGMWQYFDGAWQTIGGGGGFSVESISANQTLEVDKTYLVDTSASRILTMPAPELNKSVRIKDSTGSSNSNNITVNPNGAETLDGASSLTLDSNFGSVLLVSDGSNWFIL